ncbi:MAG: glutamate 5-kinase [Bacteroidales bacterium]|nr:glutamate 5-kinase [Bacteroidales bacterium]
MTITIKIGSNVLTRSNGTLDTERMAGIVAEIAMLHRQGHKIILVTSGAVAAGRSMISGYQSLDPVAQRQLLSSIGQVKLIDQYKQIFDLYNIRIGQILVTKQDFSTREHYLNMKNCISTLWDSNVIPVVNENDTVSVTSLMFTDNDELSGLMASMMNCEKLFILSNIDGIFNGNPNDEGTSVIREIKPGVNISQYVQTTKSGFGRGGMQTKCRIARKTADSGIDVYIANGTKQNVITTLVNGDKDFVCTHFVAGEQSAAVKKWIAYSDGFAKATVVVNQGAKNALLSHSKAASLLMPGVVKFLGDFKKDDLLLICDEQNETIGVGRATMDKDKAENLSEDKHSKPLIHYDYLYIYPDNLQ